MSQRRMTDVSSPPEYASTTFFTRLSSFTRATPSATGLEVPPHDRSGLTSVRAPALAGAIYSWREVPEGGQVPPPSRSMMMPFWACRRFSAWSKITLRGPSSTASVISSPRCAGRQCMTSARGDAKPSSVLVDLVALKGLQAPLAIGLLPHADPGVRVDHVGALGRLAGVRREAHPPAERPAGVEDGRQRARSRAGWRRRRRCRTARRAGAPNGRRCCRRRPTPAGAGEDRGPAPTA